MSTALVTGAGGFVGRHLVKVLAGADWQIKTLVRNQKTPQSPNPCAAYLAAAEPLLQAGDVDVVFHLGGLAHAGAQGADEAQMRLVTVDQTLALYRRAVAAGVPRFVWLSSIKVLGDTSAEPLGVNAPYQPGDIYAAAKVQAERALLAEPARDTQLCIVRPPLVYGSGVQANFLSLLQAAGSGWMLPLKSATAPRAWLAVDNLCDFLLLLATREVLPAPQIWHVRDAEQSSVAMMLTSLREMMHKPPALVPVPASIALAVATLLGRRAMAQRLFLPLMVDMTLTQNELGWQPPLSQAQALAQTVTWFQTR
jgi:UDP-N-acetyl-alpha-D-quinovosamine dehydrogenase